MTRNTVVKTLNPRQADQKYLGDEPTWTPAPSEDERRIRMLSAFKWYGYYYGRKDARDMVAAWLESAGRRADAKKYRAQPESTMDNPAIGWLARMNTVGLELTPHETRQLEAHIQAVLNTVEVEQEAETASNKPNIQDRLRERARECGGELEGLFDEFIAAQCKMTANFKPASVLRSMNIQPAQVSIVVEPWRRRLTELEAVLAERDAQLVEGYSHLSKTQLKSMAKFCETVINDCASHIQQKKVERKPRAKQAVAPEKQASKFKYQATDATLGLTSVPPAKLVNATEAYLYNTATRKLVHLVADPHLASFTVKNGSIVGYDTANTLTKTLRKPAETLKEVMSAGKPAARRVFKDIKTTETQWNGRGNDTLVILRVW